MLKKAHIINFLSCQDTDIGLDTITALIGRNAAGKTNILKAIQWFAQFAVGNEQLNVYSSDFIAFKTECSIEFIIDDQSFKYEIRIDSLMLMDAPLMEALFCYANGNWQLIAKREGDSAIYYNEEEINIEINAETPMISSLLALLPQKRISPSINKIFDYLSGIRYYTLDNEYKSVVSNNSEIISGNDYRQWLSKNNKSDSSVIMRLLHLWHEDEELLEELQALIGENGLNLVENIDISKFYSLRIFEKKQQDLYTVGFNIANGFVNYAQLSYGTQRVLTLLLALLYDKNSTLLIEQPEDGIHSGLLTKLLPLCFEYAETYNKQLIIATHSPEVINLLPPESIRLVRMTENGTKVSPLNEEQVPFIREYIENEGALFDFIESMDDQ